MWCFSDPEDPSPAVGPDPVVPVTPEGGGGESPPPDTPPGGDTPPPAEPPLVGPGGICPCVCDDAEIVSETVVNEPADITRPRLAVGERVRLTYSKGSADWTVAGGDGPDHAPELSGTSGETITLTAPRRGGSLTVTATGGGCSASLALTIVEPAAVRMVKKFTNGHIVHRQGIANIGFLTNVFLAPDDVNFHRVQVRELEAEASLSGIYTVWAGNAGHHASPQGTGFTTHVQAGVGTFLQESDRLHITNQVSATPNPWVAPQTGTIAWAIPWKWRMGTSGAWQTLATVHQRGGIDATGLLTLSKAGAHGSIRVEAPTNTSF